MNSLNTISASLSDNEWVIQILILLVLIITLVYYHIQTKNQRKQTEIQNNLYKAQILRDRFDLYNNTKDLITDDHIKDFKDFNQDYINDYSDYYKGKENVNNIHTYLYLGKIYEYLLYVFKLREVYKLDDPIGDTWEKQWLSDFKDEQAFIDLREFNRNMYPDFDEHIEDHIKNVNNNSTQED